MRDYALAALAGIWLADGLALLIAPRYIVIQVQKLLHQSPAVLRWEFLTVVGGFFLLFAAQELPYRWLWRITAGSMIAKGIFLATGPAFWRGLIIDWCAGREDIDYRFWGLGLCTLAVLLLHALGWLGRN